MVEAQGQEEKVYNWEVMEIGHEAPPLTIEVTKESIARYATSVQNNNPIYFDDAAARAAGFDGIIAPPTMLYTYSPCVGTRSSITWATSPPNSLSRPHGAPHSQARRSCSRARRSDQET